MENDKDPNGDGEAQKLQQVDTDIDLQSDVMEAAAPLKDKLSETMAQGKDAGADKLHSLATAVTGAADGFEDQMPQIAQYIRDAGVWMERSAGDVREQKFEEVLANVSQFARTRPAMAFGLAALSGFALSRFLKAGKSQPAMVTDPAAGE